MSLTLPPRDARIHVFSLSDGALKLAHQTYLSRLSDLPDDATPLVEAFGAPIDSTYAEVFAIQDIAPMGLRDYLAAAHDILPEALAPQAARLDGLDGDVVVLAPGALDAGGSLTLKPELTHIGSFATLEADNAPRDLPPAVKEPGLAAPAPSSAPPVGRKWIAVIVVAALILAALLLLII